MVNLFIVNLLGCTRSSRTICTTDWAPIKLSDNFITACSVILWVLAKWVFLHLLPMKKKNINQLFLLISLRVEVATCFMPLGVLLWSTLSSFNSKEQKKKYVLKSRFHQIPSYCFISWGHCSNCSYRRTQVTQRSGSLYAKAINAKQIQSYTLFVCFIIGLGLVFIFIFLVYGLLLFFSVVNYFSYTWCLKSLAFWIRKSPVALHKYLLAYELIFLVWNNYLLLLLVPKDTSLIQYYALFHNAQISKIWEVWVYL